MVCAMIQYSIQKIVPTVFCAFLVLSVANGVYAQIESPNEIIEEQLNIESGQDSGLEQEQADPLFVPFSGDSELNIATLIAKTVGYFLLIIALIIVTVYTAVWAIETTNSSVTLHPSG